MDVVPFIFVFQHYPVGQEVMKHLPVYQSLYHFKHGLYQLCLNKVGAQTGGYETLT